MSKLLVLIITGLLAMGLLPGRAATEPTPEEIISAAQNPVLMGTLLPGRTPEQAAQRLRSLSDVHYLEAER